MSLNEHHRHSLTSALEAGGLRSTRQREQVYEILLSERDHPTADDVYARAREQMPTISLATVYNCLETLVDCDLIKKLNYERGPSRFCPNMQPHAHFLDEGTGNVYDVELPAQFFEDLKRHLPKGFEAAKINLSFSGHVEPGSSFSNSSQS